VSPSLVWPPESALGLPPGRALSSASVVYSVSERVIFAHQRNEKSLDYRGAFRHALTRPLLTNHSDAPLRHGGYNNHKLVTFLNLIWLFVAFAASAAVLLSERRRTSTRAARCQRLTSVLLATVSLFPCVSASDDVISFAYVSAGLETRSGFGHSVPDHSDANAVVYLALQNLEHLQITAFYTLLVAFCIFGSVWHSTLRSMMPPLPSFVSRGPPDLRFAS